MGLLLGVLHFVMSYAEEKVDLIDINNATESILKERLGLKDTEIQKIIEHQPYVRTGQLAYDNIVPPDTFRDIQHLIVVNPTGVPPHMSENTWALGRLLWGIFLLTSTLLVLLGVILTFHEAPAPSTWHTPRGWVDDLKRKVCRSVLWILIGGSCLTWSYSVDLVPIHSPETLGTHLKQFFSGEQTTLLALIVALAAYTSSVEQILRGKIRAPERSDRSRVGHDVDLKYLYRTDIILVIAGAALIGRMALSAFGHHSEDLDRLIIGLLAWIILYFCVNHIRQFVRPLLPEQNNATSLQRMTRSIQLITQQQCNGQWVGKYTINETGSESSISARGVAKGEFNTRKDAESAANDAVSRIISQANN